MADTKITALTAISTVDPAIDVLPIVDVSDTTMAASGTTKKITSNQILGAGGTATLASATITGDLTVDTNVLKVDSANNRVGILTASPTVELEVGDGSGTRTIKLSGVTNVLDLGFGSLRGGSAYGDVRLWTDRFRIYNNAGTQIIKNISGTNGDETWYDGAGGTRMTLNSTGLGVGDSPFAGTRLTLRESATNPNALAMTNRNATQTWRLSVDVNAVDDKILGFYDSTSTTFRMQLTDTGNLGVGVTPSGSGGCLQLKSGITFPATQVASSDANTLDDYEEGTWVPVIADASTGGNVGTVTINSATYTKIGRQVSIQCDLRSITTTGMTGGNNLFIRGLPFASVKGGNGSFYTYRVGRNASTVSSAVTVEHGVSHAILSLFTASSANTNISILVSDIVSTTSELALSVTYTV